MQETVLPDPTVVADSHSAFVVAFENRPVTHVNVVAEVDCLGVEDQHLVFKDDVIADTCEL
jgi:hypothetical protein